MSYKSNRQASTKFSPYFLVYGIQMRLPIELESCKVNTDMEQNDKDVLESRITRLGYLNSFSITAKCNLLNLSKHIQYTQMSLYTKVILPLYVLFSKTSTIILFPIHTDSRFEPLRVLRRHFLYHTILLILYLGHWCLESYCCFCAC